MWHFIYWLWNRRPGAERREREHRDRFEKLMAGPYRVTVVRHDLSREVVATGLTLQQTVEVEMPLIADEAVLNFEHTYDGPCP